MVDGILYWFCDFLFWKKQNCIRWRSRWNILTKLYFPPVLWPRAVSVHAGVKLPRAGTSIDIFWRIILKPWKLTNVSHTIFHWTVFSFFDFFIIKVTKRTNMSWCYFWCWWSKGIVIYTVEILLVCRQLGWSFFIWDRGTLGWVVRVIS